MEEWVDDVEYDHYLGVVDPTVGPQNYKNFINAVRNSVAMPDPDIFNVLRIQQEFGWLQVRLQYDERAVSILLGRHDLYVYGMLNLPSNRIWTFSGSPVHPWGQNEPLNQHLRYADRHLNAGMGFTSMYDAIFELSKPVVDPIEAATDLKRLAILVSEASRFHSVLSSIVESWWSGAPLDDYSQQDVNNWSRLSTRLEELSQQGHGEVEPNPLPLQEVQHNQGVYVKPHLLPLSAVVAKLAICT